MDRINLQNWLYLNRVNAIEVLRMYLGVGLLVKGVEFLLTEQELVHVMHEQGFDFFPYFAIHYIIIAHVVGGLLLIVGLLTRFAAIAQLPIIAGAIFFVQHSLKRPESIQTLEFLLLVFFLMIVFVIYGSGKLSLDHFLERTLRKNQA